MLVAEAHYQQALAAWQGGDQARARQLLMAAVRADPRHEQAWLQLAVVVDDPAQAADCLRRVLALNPNNTQAREWLAQREGGQPPAGPEDDIPLLEPGDEARPVPRLGQFLLEFKFVTAEQLKAALREQRHAGQAGQAPRIGDILLQQGAVAPERLNFAVREQQRTLYQRQVEAG